jgi:hypothetical protein
MQQNLTPNDWAKKEIHHDTPLPSNIIYYHHHHSNQRFNMQLDYPSRSFHSFGTNHLNFVAMRRLLLRWPSLKWRRGASWAFRLAFGRENRVIVNLSMPAGCTRALHRLTHADTESLEITFLLQKVSNFRRHQDNPR